MCVRACVRQKDIDNYCGISLVSVLGIVLSLVPMDRLKTITDLQLKESESPFSHGQLQTVFETVFQWFWDLCIHMTSGRCSQ